MIPNSLKQELCERGFSQLFDGVDPIWDVDQIGLLPSLREVLAGIELEAFVATSSGKPANLQPFFERHRGSVNLMNGNVIPEAGRAMVEFVTLPGQPFLALMWLRGLVDAFSFHQLPPGLQLRIANDWPEAADLGWEPTPRYLALLEAIEEEGGAAARERMTRNASTCCATHFHFGINPWHAAGVRVINYLNNLGPLMQHLIGHRIFGAPANRSSLIWGSNGSRWADPRRLPDNRWFGSPEEMKALLGETPRLLSGDGSYPDRKTVGLWDDHQHLKCTWWLVRPSRHGTVEARMFSSMPLPGVRIAMALCLLVVRAALLKFELPRISDEDWWTIF